MKIINPHIGRRFRLGYMYNAYTALQENLAPPGWRVPTVDDYTSLMSRLGNWGYITMPDKIRALKSKWFWDVYEPGPHDTARFTLLPGGRRVYLGEFYGLTHSAFLLTSDWGISEEGVIHTYYLSFDDSSYYWFAALAPNWGGYIRLIKNNTHMPPGNIVYDIDGNGYRCTKVGYDTIAQVWMAENYKCTRFNDGSPIPEVTDNANWNNLTTPARCYYDNNPLYF